MSTPVLRSSLGDKILSTLSVSGRNVSWYYRGVEVERYAPIRDEDNRCPVCSALFQIDPRINYVSDAHAAARNFLGRHLTREEYLDIEDIMTAADVNLSRPLREFFIQTLNPSV